MANQIQNLLNKFNSLPIPAKAAIAVGSGLGLYFVFNRNSSAKNKNTSSDVTTDNTGTVYYPYASSSDNGFTESGYSYDNLGYGSNYDTITADDLNTMISNGIVDWGNNYMESIGTEKNDTVGDTISVGAKNQTELDKALYQAQFDYGNAKTASDKAAAAAAGQAARAAGATDSGADSIWKANAKTSSGSSSGSNSGVSSNIMVQGTGGSGKTFVKDTSGTITVTQTNGTVKKIKPGEAGYSATHSAMNADLGIK